MCLTKNECETQKSKQKCTANTWGQAREPPPCCLVHVWLHFLGFALFFIKNNVCQFLVVTGVTCLRPSQRALILSYPAADGHPREVECTSVLAQGAHLGVSWGILGYLRAWGQPSVPQEQKPLFWDLWHWQVCIKTRFVLNSCQNKQKIKHISKINKSNKNWPPPCSQVWVC